MCPYISGIPVKSGVGQAFMHRCLGRLWQAQDKNSHAISGMWPLICEHQSRQKFAIFFALCVFGSLAYVSQLEIVHSIVACARVRCGIHSRKSPRFSKFSLNKWCFMRLVNNRGILDLPIVWPVASEHCEQSG